MKTRIWDVSNEGLKRHVQRAALGGDKPSYRKGVCIRIGNWAKVITWRGTETRAAKLWP